MISIWSGEIEFFVLVLPGKFQKNNEIFNFWFFMTFGNIILVWTAVDFKIELIILISMNLALRWILDK
jgi:hypothetical protein